MDLSVTNGVTSNTSGSRERRNASRIGLLGIARSHARNGAIARLVVLTLALPAPEKRKHRRKHVAHSRTQVVSVRKLRMKIAEVVDRSADGLPHDAPHIVAARCLTQPGDALNAVECLAPSGCLCGLSKTTST